VTTETVIELGRRVLMNTYGRLPVAPVRGQGSRLWDADGREYLDFVSGLAANALGHCHPAVVEAVREQAGRLLHVSNLYHIAPQAELAAWLVERSFADRAFFCNSGAEAVEGALKLARKRAWRRARAAGKAPDAVAGPDTSAGSRAPFEVIAFHKSFHGRTYGALSATGQPRYHQGFEPLLPGIRLVPYGDLDAVARAASPATCAVLVEPVQGEGGLNVPPPGFLPGLRAMCDRHGWTLVFDEIQCGLGRTGRLFCHQHFGVEPDVMTLAKALGGGVAIGAVLAREDVAAAFEPGDHASTFGGNPLACAAALATLRVIEAETLPERAARLGAYLSDALRALARTVPGATIEFRGLGLLQGVRLAFPGAPVVQACLERGLLVNCTDTDVLRLLPPLVVTEAEIDRALEILEASLVAVTAALPA